MVKWRNSGIIKCGIAVLKSLLVFFYRDYSTIDFNKHNIVVDREELCTSVT